MLLNENTVSTFKELLARGKSERSGGNRDLLITSSKLIDY